MSKISTYSLADTPLQLSDRLIGTEAPRPQPTATPLATKNFSLGELLQLFSQYFPADTLQAVLDAGNIATQDMFITGTIDVTLIKPTNIEDILGSQGTNFQFLSKATTGINWVNLPVDNLQAVLNAGNTATQNINLTGNITSTRIIPGNIQDYTTSIGTTGQVLTKSTSGIVWSNFPIASTPGLNDVLLVGNTSLQNANIGALGLWDSVNSNYITIGTTDQGITFNVPSVGEIFLAQNDVISFGYGALASITNNLLTASRIFQLPNASGTIALTSDIPAAITLTTTGTSGAATLVGSTLNIPVYAGGSTYTFTSPLVDTAGVITINQSNTTTNGYLSSTDWNIFNGKQDTITLTTTGSGAATFISNVLNIPTPPTATFTSLTTTGSSGSSTLIAGVLNVPTYTLAGLGGQTALSGTGIVKSTAGTISYINGTTAEYVRGDGSLATFPTITGGTVTSVAALTLGTTGTDLSSTVANPTTTPVITLNVPTASATNRGALSSTDWSTFNSKQNAITLTTTGSSGSSTLIGSTLNIPTYTLAGLGGVPTSRNITINGTTYDLSADRTWSVGTVTSVSATSPITSTGGTTPVISTSMATNKLIGRSTAGTGVMEEITIGSGLALSGGTLSSSGSPGSILHGTASGTDTYTVTIAGATAYADGDAYLVRFTNGNTTGATLNINGLGAIPLYRNNDGQVIGGDIWAGAEMLCVYNSSINVFQCIGTSSNSLFAYVTNADSVSITKGQPVYAFGGTGDRLTVKRAFNTSDAGSARTIGVVLSSSIAVNQKGIIIIEGLLDGLNILPTSTWADGDTVYLGTTAGSITNVKQYAPNHLVYLGTVTTASNGSAGRWYVKVQNGYELDELHNVQAQSPSLKDTLWYDSGVTPGQWKTASIPTILGYTPLSSANNGLSLSGTIAQLGGTLLQATTIDGGSSSAYNLTFINGDFIISNGSGVGGARGNIILSNNRNIYWGSSSGNYISADSSLGGFIYYAPPSTGNHLFYSSVQFFNYGSGTKTGTATYNLSVTSTGNIIETAIPPTIPTLTAGSVLFSNGTTIAQDNANFFWDDTNNRLGIGTAVPLNKLDIVSSTNNSFDAITLRPNNVTQTLSLGWRGISASFDFIVDAGGSERMRITNTGNTGINTSFAETKLQVEDVTKVLTNNVAGVAQGTLSLATTDAQTANIGPSLVFGGTYIDGDPTKIAYAAITGRKQNSVSVNADGYLSFLTWRSTGLTEAMRITSNGDVGVGTTSPLLTAAGRGNITINGSSESVLTLATGGVWKGYLYSNGINTDLSSAADLTFGPGGGVEKARITAAGDVGIGTTIPEVKLDILGSGTVQSRVQSTSGGDIRMSADSIGRLGTYSNSDLLLLTNGSERMRITSGGNVGIGTTIPGNKLSVVTGAGGDDILPALGSNGGKFSLLNNNGLYGFIAGVLGTTGATYLQAQRVDGTATAYNLLLNPNGGNVGIGTSIPTTELDVNGVITATGGNSTSWNAKQDALVSGTNIKTINGNNILGSGNLVVSGGSGLQGIHTLCKPLSGVNYTNMITSGSTSFANSANILYLFPYIPAYTYSIDQLTINVSVLGSAGTTLKVLIFSDNNGLPNTKLVESSNLDMTTIGPKTFITSQTFTAGVTYWLGIVSNAGSGSLTSNSQSLQIATSTSTISYNAFSLNVTYASIPSTLTITSGNLAAISSIPKINFRAV